MAEDDTATTVVCFARTVGSSCSSGCSTRSTTGGAGSSGANDHEADWEKVMVYLSESESGGLRPEWVACGPQLHGGQPPSPLGRRRSKGGEHPVIYVGAGSHASYYARAST